MCHKFNLTPEDLESIISYVNEETEGMPSFDSIGNFQALYVSLQRKLANDYQEMQKKCF